MLSITGSLSNTFYRINDLLRRGIYEQKHPKYVDEIFQRYNFNGDALPSHAVIHDMHYTWSETNGFELSHTTKKISEVLKAREMVQPVMQFIDPNGAKALVLHMTGKQDSRAVISLDALSAYKDTENSSVDDSLEASSARTDQLVLLNKLEIIAYIYQNITELYIIDPKKSKCLQKRTLLVEIFQDRGADLLSQRDTIPNSIFEEIFTGKHKDLQLGNTPEYKLFTENADYIVPEEKAFLGLRLAVNSLHDVAVNWGVPFFNKRYPLYIQQLFAKNNFSGNQLLIRQVDNGEGITWEYPQGLDFTKCRKDYYKFFNKAHMSEATMQFKDYNGDGGIVVHIRGKKDVQKNVFLSTINRPSKDNEEETIILAEVDQKYELKQLEAICFIFQNKTRVLVFDRDSNACLQDTEATRQVEDEECIPDDDAVHLFKKDTHLPKTVLEKLFKGEHDYLQIGEATGYPGYRLF